MLKFMLDKADPYEVQPWMINPPELLYWLICPTHQVKWHISTK